jgi:hypothetical protein
MAADDTHMILPSSDPIWPLLADLFVEFSRENSNVTEDLIEYGLDMGLVQGMPENILAWCETNGRLTHVRGTWVMN